MDVAGGGGPSAPPAGGVGTALGQVGQILGVQQQLNQQKLFQLQYGARVRAGQIISAAPDLETGLEQARQDPAVAAAPDVLNQFREMQQTLTHTQGMQLEQNTNGLQAVMKAASAAINDPSKTRQYFEMALSSLPPEIRARDMPAASQLFAAVTDGGRADGPTMQQNLMGIYGAAGGTPAGLQTMTGVTGYDANAGDRIVIGGRSLLTGNPVGKPGEIGTGTAPGWETPGQVPVGALHSGGGPGISGPGTSGPPKPGASFGPNPLLGGMNFDAQGHMLPSDTTGATTGSLGAGGVGVQSPAQLTMNKGLADRFVDADTKSYNAAQQVLGSVNYMNAALDSTAKAGGLLTPGTGGELRSNLARGVNTLSQMFGGKPPFDPSAVASAEDMFKESNKMAFQVTNQYLGAQREAAETINKSLASVPSLNNSYLGGKLVLDGIAAGAQRQVDLYKFQQQWAQQHQGNLEGAEVAFNEANPPSKYTAQVLSKYGLDEGGFRTPQDVGKAVQAGFMTPKQARQILIDQFGATPKGQ